MLVDPDHLHRSGRRGATHDPFAHLAHLRFEQQPGVRLAVRKYALVKRGAIACDIQHKPGTAPTAQGQAEVGYLLERLAWRGPRL